MASNVAKSAGDSIIVEHDVVRLLRDTVTDEGTVPAGAIGAVVHIYGGGGAFEVEFDRPFHVVTVMSALVERLSA